MATLYVTETGARIEKEYKRLLVTKHDEVLAAAPLSRVSKVVLVGRVGATTPALLSLLDAGVGLSFVNRSGHLRGRLMPPTIPNAPLRKAQYLREDDPAFCLTLSKAVVRGKLHNSRTLMMRLKRRRHIQGPWLARVDDARAQVGRVQSLAALRGVEGSAAKAYFAHIRQAVRPEMRSGKRSRRPPKDPFNALLSLGYSLLYESVISALEIVGLDPYIGFFHADKYGRPALALDMVEEFRAPIVDSLVLTLVNKRMIRPKDFEPGGNGGVYLSRRARRVFYREFSDRLEVRTLHPVAGRRLTYRQWFEVQARILARFIHNKTEAYHPFHWR
jgi:CRISPR-associated protein Cas1